MDQSFAHDSLRFRVDLRIEAVVAERSDAPDPAGLATPGSTRTSLAVDVAGVCGS